MHKAVVSLITGLEDPAVRLATAGVAVGVACDGCPPLADLLDRYGKAGGRFLVCPICFTREGSTRAPSSTRPS